MTEITFNTLTVDTYPVFLLKKKLGIEGVPAQCLKVIVMMT